MASLTLKNIPDGLLEALRQAAERDRRSLSQEILHLVEAALEKRPVQPESRRADKTAQLSAWRKLAGTWCSDENGEAESAGIMKSRTPGRAVDL